MSTGVESSNKLAVQSLAGSVKEKGPSVNSGSSSDCEPKSEEEHNRAVQNLARIFTAQSTQTHSQSPFTAVSDRLNPKSDRFSAKDWAKAFYNVRYNSEDNVNPRVAGVAFRNLNVWGEGTPTDFQSSVGNSILKLPSLFRRREQRIDILRNLDGLILPGEQLCVLGPPGFVFQARFHQLDILMTVRSGCSTLLKTIAGDTYGFNVDLTSYINYQGITPKKMHSTFRGEAIYTAEVDAHYPQLPVGTTLYFAALARTPRAIPGGISREEYAAHLRDVIMAMFGITHTFNSPVGNDFVRGISGGERKRVTIAEAALSMCNVIASIFHGLILTHA